MITVTRIGKHLGAEISGVDLSQDLPDAVLAEIRAALRHAANYSGYEWSTAEGGPVRIASGTLCNAEIVVQVQRPLSLVLPSFRKSLGVD